MQFSLAKPRSPRRRFGSMRMQPREGRGLAKQMGELDSKSCAACGRVASVRHCLKISRNTSAWIVRLCPACEGEVAALPALAELLWFQARGVDALALASCKSGRRRSSKGRPAGPIGS